MKTLTLQGHTIEYPDEWADDYFVPVYTSTNGKRSLIKVIFKDKNLKVSGVIEKEITQ